MTAMSPPARFVVNHCMQLSCHRAKTSSQDHLQHGQNSRITANALPRTIVTVGGSTPASIIRPRATTCEQPSPCLSCAVHPKSCLLRSRTHIDICTSSHVSRHAYYVSKVLHLQLPVESAQSLGDVNVQGRLGISPHIPHVQQA